MAERDSKTMDQSSEANREGESQARPGTEGATPDEQDVAQRIASLESQLADARAEAASNWDRFLRERAEMENFRKRQERMANDRVQREKRDILGRVLDVVDNLDRALLFQDTLDREGLQQGLRMLEWQLNELLKAEGLTTVPTVGQPFDPYVHEAIESVASDEYPEGIVVEEARKGYKLGDETLRPARVKVSAGAKASGAEQK